MTRRSRMIEQITPGDSVFAIGHVYLEKTNVWILHNTGFLVRTTSGSYYLLAEGVIEKASIRAVFQRPVNVTLYRAVYTAIRLVTDNREIYFVPVEVNPKSLKKPLIFAHISSKETIRKITSLHELKILEECLICGLIRPAEQPQCSNPECAPKLAARRPLDRKKTILIKYLRWGVVVGLLIFVSFSLGDLFAQGFHWSPKTITLLNNLRTPVFVITAIAYLGRAILINMMEKDQHLE